MRNDAYTGNTDEPASAASRRTWSQNAVLATNPAVMATNAIRRTSQFGKVCDQVIATSGKIASMAEAWRLPVQMTSCVSPWARP